MSMRRILVDHWHVIKTHPDVRTLYSLLGGVSVLAISYMGYSLFRKSDVTWNFKTATALPAENIQNDDVRIFGAKLFNVKGVYEAAKPVPERDELRKMMGPYHFKEK